MEANKQGWHFGGIPATVPSDGLGLNSLDNREYSFPTIGDLLWILKEINISAVFRPWYIGKYK